MVCPDPGPHTDSLVTTMNNSVESPLSYTRAWKLLSQEPAWRIAVPLKYPRPGSSLNPCSSHCLCSNTQLKHDQALAVPLHPSLRRAEPRAGLVLPTPVRSLQDPRVPHRGLSHPLQGTGDAPSLFLC